MENTKKSALVVTVSIIAIILICCVILLISVNTIDFPQKPALTNSKVVTEQDCKTKEITNFKDLSNSLIAQRTNIFDLIIVHTLLPLLTTLITGVFTYIIAKEGIASFSNFFLERAKLNQQKRE